MKLAIFALAALPVLAQQTHTVKVNADGSFTPRVLYIRGGDTVRWEQLGRGDSIIPANEAAYPAVCSARRPWDGAAPNEFTGPMPFAPSGIYTLSPLDNGFQEVSGACPGGARPVYQGDNGRTLCPGRTYEATLDSTWKSDGVTGVFIRLLWKDVNPRSGVYDFTVLQREVEQAVRNGKVYSLGIKAGDDGTPDWIFSTSADGSARAQSGGVPRLKLQQVGDDVPAGTVSCGNRMDLGSPTRAAYRQLYFAMLGEVAKFLKSRADWYRALGYIKISGANLVSHENRLPETCEVIGSGASRTECICNPAIFAADGYRPSGLYSFYDEQEQLLRNLFPGKAMSYALIQAGFPRINEAGDWETAAGTSSGRSPLPGGTEQTQTVLDRGQQNHKLNFVVQHNGLTAKLGQCSFDGVHPKPVRPLDAYGEVGNGCPNRWAVREGAEGQITGFQTNNRVKVNTPEELDLTILNAWDNSDGVFVEVYEELFWLSQNSQRGVLPRSGKTFAAWANDFHKRRVDPAFPWAASALDPFPSTHSFRFSRSSPGTAPQTFYYVHGAKCGAGNNEWGMIVMDAPAPAIKQGGVVSSAAFGGFAAVAPGSWIEIYGSGLATTTREWSGADFNGLNAPSTLDGTTVRVGGQGAFVRYVSPEQVNVQVPSNISTGSQSLTVSTAVGTSASYPITVTAAQPGLLAPPSFLIGGRQLVVALFTDGVTYVLPPGAIPGVPARRARPGEVITLYGVGFGAVTPAIAAGQVVKQANSLALPFQLSIGGARAATSYAGLAPDAIGLYQFNVTVPQVEAGDAVPVTFTLGGTAGTQTLYLAVGN
ncbi:MAG: hypothetical protein U0Q16_08470 [Bryobacteraceae bacterium]